ncbi:MAG: hypothetical protein EOP55_20285, partial [Sphingobacteriales bacterium]
MDKSQTIAGKPLDRFYKLPFEKGGRVLSQQVLEANTAFRADKNPYYQVNTKVINFKHGLIIMRLQIEEEPAVQIYFKVEYDHLLVSCSVDTDESYLSRYVYRTLRAMMWNGVKDFQEYYWPACFDLKTGKSKYLNIFNDRSGFEIKLKENFKGFFRPDDQFPYFTARIVVDRMPIKRNCMLSNPVAQGIGYCLVNTDLEWFHSNHYPFLIPYLFTSKADRKSVKSFERFVFDDDDAAGMMLSPQQLVLNQICFEMKQLAPLQFLKFKDTPEREVEIRQANCTNRDKLFRLWHKVMPILVCQSYTHYQFTYGLRNIERRPMKKRMQPAAFSIEVPKLSFLLSDRGDYYELFLRLKIKGKLFKFGTHEQALFLVCAKHQPNLWYLLEAELDGVLVAFFVKVGFKMQVPMAYYTIHFERYLKGLEAFY